MKFLAIVGDHKKGEQIIQLLTELGAVNMWKYKGNCESWVYFMNESKILNAIPKNDILLNINFKIFTYDDFIKMYHLQVGDKVSIHGFNSGEVLAMKWNTAIGDMTYRVKVYGDSAPDGAIGWWTCSDILSAGDNVQTGADPAEQPCRWYDKQPSVKDFGFALNAMKQGKRVTRKGWNGKGMYLWLKPASTIKAEWCQDPQLKAIAEDNGGRIDALGTICMKTADNKIVTGWFASQTDMLAEDWEIL